MLNVQGFIKRAEVPQRAFSRVQWVEEAKTEGKREVEQKPGGPTNVR